MAATQNQTSIPSLSLSPYLCNFFSSSYMGPTLFIIFIFLSYAIPSSFSGPLRIEFIYPNFTATNLLYIDHAGAFLSSRNGTFKASMFNPDVQQSNFYLSILHVSSNTIIWSANRDSPISNSGKLTLSVNGLTISEHDGNLRWSTPMLRSTARALTLTETGNLVLLDRFNLSLWESFITPTDTIVPGQKLVVGSSLISSVSEGDLSAGDYKFEVSEGDGVLQWNNLTYWRLSMGASVYRDTSSFIDYMAVNSTGLFMFSRNGSEVVLKVILPPSDFRIVKLDQNGRFVVRSFSVSRKWTLEFEGPDSDCKIPFVCGPIGLCSDLLSTPGCSCLSGFHDVPNIGCLPTNSVSLPSVCNSTSSTLNSSEFSYIKLESNIDYFMNDFSTPDNYGTNLSACQSLCSNSCSCLGFYYSKPSGSCNLIKNQLGSFLSNPDIQNNRSGYIKTVKGVNHIDKNVDNDGGDSSRLPLAPVILLPCTGFFLLVIFFMIWIIWKRRKRLILSRNQAAIKLGRFKSSCSAEFDILQIPGLPVRFDYDELDKATENFSTQIGSGGFGSVYKGELRDKTLVAVKRITNLGVQGKKEFCTEIAIIGKIHHMNLVKLRGFCAEGRQRLLVYEYMNRGSLDRTLFGSGPVLEWQERADIAMGTGRGLAYLHSGCENKIIHCDIKPENILLHDHSQVKISDFGLSKLLSPEQSSHFTTMRGTRGYLAPEWLTSSAISDKTDVYSYGMVLLEIVSGRKNCAPSSQNHSTDNDGSSRSGGPGTGFGLVYFPLFALEKHEQRRYIDLADPRLEGRVSNEEVEKLIRVALCCVHEEPMLRPSMTTVVGMLEGGIPVGEPRVESLNFLRFYGRRFTESSVMGGSNAGNNEFMIYPQVTSGTTSSSHGTFASNLSSQQVSGPR